MAVARLETGGRVLDLGFGQGFAALAMARVFPRAEVWGVDADQPSIDDARAAARTEALRVRFECADAGAIAAHGPFDLVLLLEVLHDLARSVDAPQHPPRVRRRRRPPRRRRARGPRVHRAR